MRRHRGRIGFVMNEAAHYSLIDRNAKARLLHAVEALERASKRPGCPNGIVTRPAIGVLRVLMFGFHNSGSGRCDPSYDAIEKRSGYCRATVAKAIKILEALGVLRVTRRLVRVRDEFGNVFARQGSNLYAFEEMSGRIDLGSASKPLTLRRPPRVHGMRTNQNTPIKDAPAWLKEVGFSRGSEGDWRERARASMLRAR